MTRQVVPPLLTLSGAVLEAQWNGVGHITLSDRCRRPVGREKKKKPRCLNFGTRTIRVVYGYYIYWILPAVVESKPWAGSTPCFYWDNGETQDVRPFRAAGSSGKQSCRRRQLRSKVNVFFLESNVYGVLFQK